MEVADLQKENASYSQELKDASSIIHKQECVLSHIENQATVWKEECCVLLLSVTARCDAEMLSMQREM
ncbi:MAG: hypothetical protein ACKPKO_22355, partial [Candidatus Fonsibacter sp.]